jgi:hypothetical protein
MKNLKTPKQNTRKLLLTLDGNVYHAYIVDIVKADMVQIKFWNGQSCIKLEEFNFVQVEALARKHSADIDYTSIS